MNLSEKIESNLLRHLNSCGYINKFQDVTNYAVMPPGKLFRPTLVHLTANDLGIDENENLSLIASAIEVHHAYTLVHDDLPCMDDDDMRRGKPSTHKKFSEDLAVLAGDALNNMSFQLLAKINHPNLSKILQFFSWATGTKGLILGQVWDLDQNQKSFEQIIRIHELKTARLIQCSLILPALLGDLTHIEFRKLFRLGKASGISFQLIDDYNERIEKADDPHEKLINPFLNGNEEIAKATLDNEIKNIMEYGQASNLGTVSEYLLGYVNKSKNKS